MSDKKIKNYWDISNYEDYKNRPDNIIKHSVPVNAKVKISSGLPGDHIVVPSFIYDILKKEITRLEAENKKLIEGIKYTIDKNKDLRFSHSIAYKRLSELLSTKGDNN